MLNGKQRQKRLLFFGSILCAAYLSGLLPTDRQGQTVYRKPDVLAIEKSPVPGPPSLTDRRFLLSQVAETAIAERHVTPTPTLSPVPAVSPAPKSDTASPNQPASWGVATQVDQHTWTMSVGQDSSMATPQDILQALNNYRQKHGAGTLAWDQALADYAQTRASFFNNQGKLDEHAGFTAFLNNQDGFAKLGYNGLGENSSIGYVLAGVHLIEWVYAGDKPHNDNQLSPQWSAVGIGVSGTATDLIFGGSKR